LQHRTRVTNGGGAADTVLIHENNSIISRTIGSSSAIRMCDILFTGSFSFVARVVRMKEAAWRSSPL
jgi:hypothetical protein